MYGAQKAKGLFLILKYQKFQAHLKMRCTVQK